MNRKLYLLLPTLLLFGCGGDNSTKPPSDTTPPAPVRDLAVTPLGASSVRLTWTAPGDDGSAGTATQYDVRYSTTRLEGDAWTNATSVSGSPTPHIIGTGESFTVTDLSGSDTLHFALRAADEIPNWSSWSNVASGRLDGVAPAAVTDLALAFAADTSVTLFWTATGDDGHAGQASQYDLRYATNPSWTWEEMTRVADLPRPRTAAQRDTFTVNHLSPGTTYYFLLGVGDEIPNWSGTSNKVGMDPAVPPAQVTDLGVVRATPTSLVLRWTATGDDGTRGTATQYVVRMATTAGATWDEMTAVTGTSIPRPSGQADSMEVMDLDPDTDYYFRLEVVDDVSLRSAPSNLAHGKSQDVVPPAAVTDLRVVETTGSIVAVQWTKSGDNGNEGRPGEEALRYSLSPITESNWLQATYVGGWFHIGSPGDTITVEVEGLEQERTYFFAEKTADEVLNWSALSNVVSATTSDQTPPGTVSDLVAGLPTATSIKLTWTSPGDDGQTGTAMNYDIRYATAPITISTWASATPAPYAPAPSVGGSIESFTVEGLLQGTVYYFALKATDEQGNESGLSNVVSSSTLDEIPPEAIIDLTAVSATGNSVSVRWTAPGDDGATGRAAVYDARYSTAAINEESWSSANQVSGEPVPQQHGTVENFSVSGLQGGTPYYFAVKATDDAENWSSLSNVVMATTLDQLAPAAITNLTITQVGTTSLRLNWTAPGDDGSQGTASQYDVRYATMAITQQNWASAYSAAGAPTPHAAGTAEHLDLGSLQEDIAYYFALKTADEVPNWSGLSNVPSAKTLDQAPPAAVTDLQVTGTTATTVSLRWTAPGDNGTVGTAAQYDVRFTTGSLNQSTWNLATEASGEPAPGIAGTVQTLTITNLLHATSYSFGLKTADEVPSLSGLSNVVSTATRASDHIRHVPGEYATIQAAIDACTAGDTVLVAPGVYQEAVLMKTDVSLIGAGIGLTILDARAVPLLDVGAIHVHDGVGSASTFVGGFEVWAASDVVCLNARANGEVEARDCRFQGGVAGVYFEHGARVRLRGCVMDHNYYGLSQDTSTGEMTNCTLVDNFMGVRLQNVQSQTITRCIIANSDDMAVNCSGSGPAISCSCVWNNGGGNYVNCIAGQEDQSGNFQLDPLFCSSVGSGVALPRDGDYGLCSNSPCLASVSPCGQQVGAIGMACGSCAAPNPVWSGHVDARLAAWLPTATLTAGVSYHLEATGQSQMGYNFPWRDCEGCSSPGDCYGPLPADCGCPGPGLNGGGIVGRICGVVQNIPCDNYIEPSCSGLLELIANDGWGSFGDNSGGYDITISRVE
jgi:hypothetical protein